MTFILIVIFLGILITVHELGHFFACKISGIGVEEFSIGFGPRIFTYKDRSGTKYSLSLVPFGGFVKMQGEEKKESASSGDFWSQPFYKKIFVVLAGPFSNLLLAVFAFLLGYSIIGYDTLPNSRIYEVQSKFTPLVPGDSIVSVDGKKVETIEDIYYFFSKDTIHQISVVRDGKELNFVIHGNNFDSLGIEFFIPPIVNKVEKGSPAQKAGLKPGDVILRINNITINTWKELTNIVRENPGKEISLTVLRGRDTLNLSLKVMLEQGASGEKFGRIGITALSVRKRLGFLDALVTSVSRSLQITFIFIIYIIKLFRGKVPLSNIGGPIMIGKVIYTATSYGAFQLLYLLGLISINLCIVNLLPIPALDGWHFLVYLVEGITKRELPENIKRVIQFAGFILLLVLMVVIVFFDILRLFR
ncbi:MAG: RIP metalloprotease RseP [Candidatus Hydrothermia bacterium]